jgi:hypothetical protein
MTYKVLDSVITILLQNPSYSSGLRAMPAKRKALNLLRPHGEKGGYNKKIPLNVISTLQEL